MRICALGVALLPAVFPALGMCTCDRIRHCAVHVIILLPGVVVIAIVALALGSRWCTLTLALALWFGRGVDDGGRRSASCRVRHGVVDCEL